MEQENKKFLRGQIFYINGDDNNKPIGAEIWSDRMGLIVSSDATNLTSGAVEIVYLTLSTRKKLGLTHVQIKSNNKMAIAMCEQVHSVDKSRLGDYINSISKIEQKNIDSALVLSLGIIASMPHLTGMFKKWENYINKYNLQNDESQKLETKTNAMILIEQLKKERNCYKDLYESKLKTIENIKKLIK